MKQVLVIIAFICASHSAVAATAFFTGRQQMVQSVTGMMVNNCEYDYFGKKFWRAYSGMCPMTVEIQ